VHRSRKRRVRELPDGVDDPEADRYPDGVTSCRELVGSSGTLHLGRGAVAFEHQVRDAPNIDLGYHATKRLEASASISAQARIRQMTRRF
jgi:hypothetical protein